MISLPRNVNLVLCLFVVAASAWELPEFLTENQNGFEDRTLRLSTLSKMDATEQTLVVEHLVPLTDSPTESPAPSPSPSDTPTIAPTITGKPTENPTAAPTESPAPSPSPSETPSSAPSDMPSIQPSARPTVSSPPSNIPSVSPTDLPSALPSQSPSANPTISSPPSAFPSQNPSALPSASPTISMQPSASPSAAPSISSQPSSAPTLVTSVTGEFSVVLFLESGLLTDEQVSAFQNATSGFLEKDADLNNGKLTDSYVQVTSQKVVDISNDASVMANKTNEVSTLTLQQALELTFTVSATYTGSVVNLNWKETLTKYFHDPESRWYRWLGAADSVFEPITPEPTPEEKAAAAADAASASQSDWTKEGGDRNGLVAVVSVLSVLALLLGVAASIYTIRKFKDTDFVQELGSQTFTSTSLGSRIANENMEYHARQFEKPHSPDRNTRNRSSGERGLEVDSATSAWVREPKSPNSMEIGDVLALDQIVSRNSSIPKTIEDPWNQIQPNHSNESKTSKDPPTNRSEVDFPIQTTKEHSRNMMSLFDNNTEMSDMTRSHMHPHPVDDFSRIPAVEGSVATEFSNHAKSFFSGFMGGHAPGNKVLNVQENVTKRDSLQSRSMTPVEEIELDNQVSYDTMSNRAGLYDVFAPPGAIGIVVDTTKHGPAVHALKRNSPMLGLINPGDLIVGLDDEDARGMTAATLTRLMAQKSSQKERKITLLTNAETF